MPDPDEADQAELVAAIHTRRVIKCRVNGNHTDGGCASCGL